MKKKGVHFEQPVSQKEYDFFLNDMMQHHWIVGGYENKIREFKEEKCGKVVL